MRRAASCADEGNSMEDESHGRGTAWATHLAGLTRIRPIKAGGVDERRETTHRSAYVDGRHVAILGGTPPRRLPSLAVPHAFRWFQSQPPQQAGLAQCAFLLPLVQSPSPCAAPITDQYGDAQSANMHMHKTNAHMRGAIGRTRRYRGARGPRGVRGAHMQGHGRPRGGRTRPVGCASVVRCMYVLAEGRAFSGPASGRWSGSAVNAQRQLLTWRTALNLTGFRLTKLVTILHSNRR